VKRSTDRILTTHVGSLVRPPELLAFARARIAEQPVDEPAYEATLAATVREVVRHQAELGVDIIDDGEYGKSGWTGYLMDRVSGFEQRVIRPAESAFRGDDIKLFAEFYAEAEGTPESSTRWVCTGPIVYTGHAVIARDIANLQSALSGLSVEEAFLPVVAPASIAPDFTNDYYPSDEAFFDAIADALHEEYEAIVDAGLLLQVDDAILFNMYNSVAAEGGLGHFLDWATLRIKALNRALAGIPEDRVRYHVCWGSWHGPHTTDVPWRDVAELILTVRAEAFSVEAANPRHAHEWKVWRDIVLPTGKILIPGVVTHSTNIVEHPELVAERIERFASIVGAENVIAGTDCGFAQIQLIQRVHPSIMWAKLESLAEGARLASARLFGSH
jgi:5-methyltetrahydropteroyltriglutamate--homocysteine methyltransferase